MRLLLIFILFSASLSAQVGTGQWRFHIPTSEAVDVVALNDRVFVAYHNGLGEYDFSSKEISIWNAINSLSDITISCLGLSTSNNAIFVGYDNGNVDKIQNNRLVNIPAIRLAQVQGSKKIHKIVEHEGYMYFATGFSIVKIDPVNDEVRDTYYPTNGLDPIIDIAFRNDSIYALTEEKMYVGYINNVALADPSQWHVDSRVPVLVASTNSYKEIETLNDKLFLVYKVVGYGNDTIYQINPTSISPAVIEPFGMEINSICSVNNKIAINYDYGSILYDENLLESFGINNYSSNTVPRVNTVVYTAGEYWIADRNQGLNSFKNNYNSSSIHVVGPPKRRIYATSWYGGKLLVSGGGLSSVTQTFNSSGMYIFEDEQWSLKDRYNMDMWQGLNIWDYLCAEVNPTNENEIAVGTYSPYPLSILQADGQVTDTFTPNNSLLNYTNLGNGSSLVSDVKYDDNGNLWVLNGYSGTPLKVYTSSHEWYEFPVNSAASNFTFDLVIDYNGNKWFSVRGAGLFGFNDNGTISNSSDDKTVFLNTGEYSGALPSSQVNAIAVDFDNEIWIGTDNGFAVLYNSSGVFDAVGGDYNAQRIKVEFEGNVEYVLGATNITDIVVDGANRKWFATSNAGIILLSADGLEILEQHTIENSPIISNNVLDLTLDQSTGELFITTDKGLVSYRTDATYEDPEYSNVIVFPNPVRPEFDGVITIQGIRYNSDVKITDVAGKLVYQTTSNGGTATWDGKTVDGDKVPTGVYLIWTAANEDKGRKVGKVMIVR